MDATGRRLSIRLVRKIPPGTLSPELARERRLGARAPPEWAGVLATDLSDARIVFRRPPPFALGEEHGRRARPAARSRHQPDPPLVRGRDGGPALQARRRRRRAHRRRPQRLPSGARLPGGPRVGRTTRASRAGSSAMRGSAPRVRPTPRSCGASRASGSCRPSRAPCSRAARSTRCSSSRGRRASARAARSRRSPGRASSATRQSISARRTPARQSRGLNLELAELDAILRRDPSTVKAFLSRAINRFRVPYGRAPENVPRGVVFAGTVNHGAYLRDTTGHRRYSIVRCEGPLDVDGLAAARDPLWAEALHPYRSGETVAPRADRRRSMRGRGRRAPRGRPVGGARSPPGPPPGRRGRSETPVHDGGRPGGRARPPHLEPELRRSRRA